MTAWIIFVFAILFIPWLVLAGEIKTSSGLKDNIQSVNHRNRTINEKQLKKTSALSEPQEYQKLEENFLNRNQFEARKRRPKKKRQTLANPAVHAKRSPNGRNKQKGNLPGESKNVRIYETFEEIHEHIHEPDEHDAQFQASEHYEHQDDSYDDVKRVQEEKQEPHMKVKVKHHHHHHHHNHIKEVIKSVPKPYPVEKIVHVPIEKIVEKVIHVPKLVNVTVEKIVHVPVERIIEKIVRVPKPVHVPKPYVIEKIMEKIVHVPKPYPVIKTVPYPVEIKVPVAVEKKVPYPFKVEVERKVPIYIHSQEPYKYEQSYPKNFKDKDIDSYSSGLGEMADTEYHSSFLSENYNIKKGSPFQKSQLPRKPEPIQHYNHAQNYNSFVGTTSNGENYSSYVPENYNILNASPFKQTESPRKQEFQPIAPHKSVIKFNSDAGISVDTDHKPSFMQENYSINKENQFKPPEFVRNPGYQSTDEHRNIETTPMEQSTAESNFVPIKFIQSTSHFNITAANNGTAPPLHQQSFDNKLPEYPIAFPIEFIRLQPMPFHNPFRIEIPITVPSFNST